MTKPPMGMMTIRAATPKKAQRLKTTACWAFVLVHAGMMVVVFTLSGMVGGIGSPIVIVIGNIFVMGMEGCLAFLPVVIPL